MTKAELQKKCDALEELYADLSRDVVQVSLERDRFQSTIGVRDAQLHDSEKVCKELSTSETKLRREGLLQRRRAIFLEETCERYEKAYGQRRVELEAAYATLKNLIQATQTEEVCARWRDND